MTTSKLWNLHSAIVAIVIPIIAEIKPYRCFREDDNHQQSQCSAHLGVVEAQEDAEVQVQYLFSGVHQPCVIGIATAGPFWTWHQFFKTDMQYMHDGDDDYIPPDDVIDSQWGTPWSIAYKLGTQRSDSMMNRIQNWASGFLQVPHPQIDVLQD